MFGQAWSGRAPVRPQAATEETGMWPCAGPALPRAQPACRGPRELRWPLRNGGLGRLCFQFRTLPSVASWQRRVFAEEKGPRAPERRSGSPPGAGRALPGALPLGPWGPRAGWPLLQLLFFEEEVLRLPRQTARTPARHRPVSQGQLRSSSFISDLRSAWQVEIVIISVV